MKRQLLSKLWLRTTALASVLSCVAVLQANAQFNAPTSFEDTYPVAPAIGLTDHTSAYSFHMANVNPYGPVDILLAGWDHATAAQPAGVSWRLVTAPGAVVAQGVIPYTNVRDLEVGWLDVGGDPQIIVAYYDNGSAIPPVAAGHKVDVYSLSTGTPVWLYTNVLSTMPNYTRISIDCHIPPYAVAIAWEDTRGINTVCGLNTGPGIVFSNILNLTGTRGETGVDLAFNHTPTGLMLQCVYYNPTTGNITESEYDFWTAMGTAGTSITPVVNDVNYVGPCSPGTGGGGGGDDQPLPPAGAAVCPYMNIDAPGHYGVDNWAYTYTLNNNDISVRLLDLNTATLSTVIVNNGSVWGGLSTSGSVNIHPFPYYNWLGCTGTGIVVAWYTNAIDPGTGAAAGYLGLQMNENGTGLISAPDYLTVANNPTQASPTPVLSISKQDDMLPYMYTVFPEVDASGSFQMENKFPGLCFASFKGEQGAHQGIACNDEAKIAAFMNTQRSSQSNISVYPNPTKSSFSLAMSPATNQKDVNLSITDITGQVVGAYSGQAMKANAYLQEMSKQLVNGSYIINVTIDGKDKETLKAVKIQ
jgi:hypothetical protein